jgi:hypothetical protein
LEVRVSRFYFKSVLVAFAAALAIGGAGCSAGRSTLPGIAPQTLDTWRTSHAGQVTRLTSQPPTSMQLAWLLTDGSILAQSSSNWNSFYRYVPDADGGYSDGTWSQVISLQSGYGPDAAASDVLADGRFVISGGEYNTPGNGYDLQLTNLGAVYNPLTNKFTPLRHPRGWKNIGDSPSTVAPNGQLIIGEKAHRERRGVESKDAEMENAQAQGKIRL